MANPPAATDADGQKPGRALRADARRNRARVLQVAAEVFATEGLSVPVHEIARRAGVGTGTVSRHFPTKEELFAAILLDRMEHLTGQADALAEGHDAGTAFFTFFATLVHEGAQHRGLAEALAGAGYDVETAAGEAGYDVRGRLRTMLARAQEAGAVRADITYPDVKALMAGCLSREADDTHGEALGRLVAVVCEGLRARQD
ncbi:TetR/AcrR family transcriptional regulator [Planotetraspora kaengkrachanensis]|uniref:TetR family transcriptional regulator n=1 Tax=Planotetraspora kaengkrachanensis TaxID=575193 RepID=A0A8J3PSS5_9ACTN|nr:TetR/AcrR family transcriptional regulator [Planotetraspora kaengkrachanensis]GIG79353.1 TetR family transcriptional regulator [Planotetraspora kaengkrachanensis]